jgi:3-phosphoshikimate 1-carboxyvinyltransferase
MPNTVQVESDWSSLSYLLGLMALMPSSSGRFTTFGTGSRQGDARQTFLWQSISGLQTEFICEKGLLTAWNPNAAFRIRSFDEDFSDIPDLAQTFAVMATFATGGTESVLRGLQTLPLKETDRLGVLADELSVAGAMTRADRDNFSLRVRAADFQPVSEVPFFRTFKDHRMAMSFSLLALHPRFRRSGIRLDDLQVVEKSFPGYWNILENLGFEVRPY